ncbi:hypothetical protein [Candidatus Enterococcus ferrettii]|uniref:Uncharacterized protein n=1 Tax=Candidatus Enterococcus ferrettii TaxID=2815324 RepID=A0ABV0ES05_9ENTE|nr:hypothetical protein [Enterococcus sp. 665A]MBO1338904.1 hypothetical protein [Enterococcus sp. 665A]
MKKYGLVFVAGTVLAFLLCLFNFLTALTYIGFGTLLFGIVLSGTLASGDRMRANAQYKSGLPKNLFVQLIVFSLPFIIIYFTFL